MNQGSTIFLRGVVMLLGIIVLTLCVFILPIALRSYAASMYLPIVLGLYGTAVPFFVALQRAWKLLGYIDRNTAFSNASVDALRQIKLCAIIIGGAFIVGLPYMFYVATQQGGPAIMIFAGMVIFFSIVFAAFAAVLQKLLYNALELKTENDLTV